MKGLGMVNDVSPSLHTFFVPQMEQLRMKEQPCRHGSLSVWDDECGKGLLWAHQSSFTDAFRRETGMTPSQWREREGRSGPAPSADQKRGV